VGTHGRGFFPEEAGDIRSQLIAVTVVQQKYRVHRAPKKQVRISGKMTLLRGVSTAHRSSASNQASFSEDWSGLFIKSGISRWDFPRFAIVKAHRSYPHQSC
jgi:hypothetical protein